MPKQSDYLNHLAYANDAVIFVNLDKVSLQLLMEVLTKYEQQSGQKINKGKSFFFMFSKAARFIVQEVEIVTDLKKVSSL